MKNVFINLDPSIRFGIRTGVGVAIAIFIASFFHFQSPYWSGITVVLVTTPTIGGNLEKGGLRILGTIIGGFIGYYLCGFAINSYFFFLFFTFMLVGGALYLSIITKYPYMFIIMGVTAFMIIGSLISKTMPINQVVIWRISEITLGVLVAWIVSYFVFPTKAKDVMHRHLVLAGETSSQYLAKVIAIYLGQLEPQGLEQDYKTLLNHVTKAEDLIKFSKIEVSSSTTQLVMVKRMIRTFKRIMRLTKHLCTHYQAELDYPILKIDNLMLQELANCIEYCLSNIAKIKPSKQDLFDHYHQMETALQRVEEALENYRQEGLIRDYSIEESAAADSFVTNLSAICHEIKNLLLDTPDQKTIDKQREIIENTPFFNPKDRMDALKLSIKAGLGTSLAIMIWVFTNLPGGLQGIISVVVISLQKNIYDAQLAAELRLLGCLMGAIVGLSALYFLQFEITVLVLLILIVCSLFGYLSVKSKRYGYSAIQANFAFILTVVNTSMPATSIAPAMHRLAGILLGIFSTFIVARILWPTHPKTLLNKNINEALTRIQAMYRQFIHHEVTDMEANTKERIAINSIIKRSETLVETVEVYHTAAHQYLIDVNASLALISELITNLYSMIDNINYQQANKSARTLHIELDSILHHLLDNIARLKANQGRIEQPEAIHSQWQQVKLQISDSLRHIRKTPLEEVGSRDETSSLIKLLDDTRQLAKLLG